MKEGLISLFVPTPPRPRLNFVTPEGLDLETLSVTDKLGADFRRACGDLIPPSSVDPQRAAAIGVWFLTPEQLQVLDRVSPGIAKRLIDLYVAEAERADICYEQMIAARAEGNEARVS
jgi:hypothetical protein